jgi:hypothetical protein
MGTDECESERAAGFPRSGFTGSLAEFTTEDMEDRDRVSCLSSAVTNGAAGPDREGSRAAVLVRFFMMYR